MTTYRKHSGFIGLAIVAAAVFLSILSPGPTGLMFAAIAQTAVLNKTNYKSWTITCLDADTTVTFNHGFVNGAGVSIAPDLAFIQSLISLAAAAAANWGVSVSSTQITLTKQNAAGSGGGVPGTTIVAKLYAARPHSVME